MNTRSQWIGVYGDLLRTQILLRESGQTGGALSIILSVLIMLVEDKIRGTEQ